MFIVVLLIGVALCSASSENRKVVKVGIYDNPPKIFIDSNNAPAGIFPELLQEIASIENWKLEYVAGSWKECLENLDSGRIDILPDIAFSKKRAEKYLFTDQTVFVNWGGLFYKSNQNISSLSSLEGKRIAVMKGSIHTEGKNGIRALLSELKLKVTFVEASSYGNAMKLVASSKADIAAVNQLYGSLNKDTLGLISSSIVFNPIELRFAMKHKRPDVEYFKDRIDYHISGMMEKGNDKYSLSLDEIVSNHLRKELADEKTIKKAAFFDLSEKSENWIREHQTIRVGGIAEYAPYSFRNQNGEYIGVVPDILEYIESRSGIKFEIIPNLSWTAILKGAKERTIDIVPMAATTKEREKYLIFTEPYVETPLVVVANRDNDEIKRVQDIAGKRVALVKGYFTSEKALADYPDIIPVMVNSPTEALKAISMNSADAFVGVLGTSLYLAKKSGISNIQVVSNYSYERSAQHMAIRSDWPEYATILNEIIEKIPESKMIEIMDKWIQVESHRKDTVELNLNYKEKQFVLANPSLTVAVDPNLAPIEFIDKDGQLKGVTSDVLNIIASRTGLKFNYTNCKSWAENIKLLDENKVDLFSFIMKTDQREELLDFTDTYYSFSSMIFARNDQSHLVNTKDLRSKKICVIKDYVTQTILKEQNLLGEILEVNDAEAAIIAISNGDADVFIGDLLSTSYTIQKLGVSNLKVIGQAPFHISLSMASRKDLKPLQSILNKGLASITDEEWNGIFQKWYTVKIEHGFNYKLLWKIVLAAFLLIGIILLWNRSLVSQINQRRKAEDKLKRETIQKDSLVQMIVHDLRTPLQIIIGNLELITLDNRVRNSEDIENLKAIEITAENLISMVSDVIDTQKMEEVGIKLNKSTVSLVPLIEKESNSAKVINQEITFSSQFPSTSLELLCDKQLISRVIQNLLSNSIKYAKTCIGLSITETESFIKISISDDGIGIPQEYHDILFEKFGQIKVKDDGIRFSTGLGLTFCKMAVEEHGGDIGFDSTIGKGTTFWFTLPK